MISKAKFYFLGVFNVVLAWAGLVDFFDFTTRIIAAILGIILTVYLIKKAKHDIEKVKLDNQMKKLEIQEKEQKVYQLMEQSKKLGK